jgi:hypothetical protein
MPRRPVVIAALFAVAALLWWLFEILRPIPGLETKGPAEDLIPWLTLAGSLVSLLTGIVSLSLKIAEARHRPRRHRKVVRR